LGIRRGDYTPDVRFAIETHGCRLNQAETDALIEQLRERGHEHVGIEQAQLFVLNGCAITHAADADARAAIRRARRRNPDARLVITGCQANADPERLAEMPELDAVVGNEEKRGAELLDLLEGIAVAERGGSPGASKLIAVERLTRRVRPKPWFAPPAVEPRRTRPLLKIQDGCDQQCSFCIVPSVRGRSRSASVEQATTQLGALVRARAPEVVLTGAHLGSWGRELAGRGEREGGLAMLIGALLREHPSARLRLGSVDPHEVDDSLVSLLERGVDERGAGLCQHVHLPVQSGDDGVLRSMRRAHRADDLSRLLARLHEVAPDIGVGTDLICGFPGESEAAFERSLALFEGGAIPFAHVFTWSPRRGTPAAELGDRVPPEIMSRRSDALRRAAARSHRAFVLRSLGRDRSAVVLRRRTRAGSMVALTDNFLRVAIDGPDSALGRRVHVRLLEVSPLDGEVNFSRAPSEASAVRGRLLD
jgi:threonylcarbamoyladenosine tRNA methylthiotransferase MtaB